MPLQTLFDNDTWGNIVVCKYITESNIQLLNKPICKYICRKLRVSIWINESHEYTLTKQVQRVCVDTVNTRLPMGILVACYSIL